MSYSKDLGTGIVFIVDKNNNYPVDEWGHLLDKYDDGELVKDWDKPGTKLNNLTNPHGHLHFAIGAADDFYCFDFAVLDNGNYVLHSVINSETGSFIQDSTYAVVPAGLAESTALAMVDDACTWDEVSHDEEGWNQDTEYFIRSVSASVNETSPTDRELRYG